MLPTCIVQYVYQYHVLAVLQVLAGRKLVIYFHDIPGLVISQDLYMVKTMVALFHISETIGPETMAETMAEAWYVV